MRPLGLSDEIAVKYAETIRQLLSMTDDEQNVHMGALAHAMKTADVTEEFRRDMGEIFAAIKRTQFAKQAETIDF